MDNQFNILAATDYSLPAANAMKYAIQLAKATQSTIHFVHVFRPELTGTSTSFDVEKIDYNPLKYAYDKLCMHVSDCFQSAGIAPGEISHKCVIREGNNIRKQILEEADEEGSDLIILATHGANPLHSLFLGSHTWSLIKHSDIPVLAIPENAVFTDIRRIVFATEYREGEIPAILFLAQTAKNFKAEVTVLHISGFPLSEEFESMLFERFQTKVKSQLAYENLHLKLIREDKLVEGLNAYCRRENVNWLAISPEKITLWNKLMYPVGTSTGKQMTLHAQVPLYVLPDYYDTVYTDLIRMF